MLDLKFVRENLDAVAGGLNRRAPNTFDAATFKILDEQRRAAITEAEKLKAGKNDLSKKIGELKKAKEDAGDLMDRVKLMGEQVAQAEAWAAELDERLYDILKRTPNLPHASVPDGTTAEQNVKVKEWGTPPSFSFTPKPHWDLGESLGILDFERAAKVTGARFTFYVGLGARLERALIQFMLDVQTQQHGYTEMWAPLMVNAASLEGTGQLPKFEEDLFKLQSRVPHSFFLEALRASFDPNGPKAVSFRDPIIDVDDIDSIMEAIQKSEGIRSAMLRRGEKNKRDLGVEKLSLTDISECVADGTMGGEPYYLIPTAEVPITNYHRAETLDSAQLPLKYCGYTPCFRSEAGAYGKDTRGMVRQHQFNKVELVKFCAPDQSEAEHEKLTADAERILELLELPYRRLLLCAGDMGFGAQKCYDLEVYSAGQDKKWWECSSCSNFGDFQARRADIRVKLPDGKKVLAHTLNGSGLATSRVLPAILENNQQADGSVLIPKALQPYMGGLERINRSSTL